MRIRGEKYAGGSPPATRPAHLGLGREETAGRAPCTNFLPVGNSSIRNQISQPFADIWSVVESVMDSLLLE